MNIFISPVYGSTNTVHNTTSGILLRFQKSSPLALLVFDPWAVKVGKKLENYTTPFLNENIQSTPAHVRTGRRSRRRPPITIEVE